MPATFFVGDLHLYHEKVVKIRGFDSAETHNNAIIKKWLKQVKENDMVYVTGDISGGRVEEEAMALWILSTLPGRKRLIAGNHDGVSGVHSKLPVNRELFHQVFEKINDYGHIQLNGKRILLSHYPYLASGDGPGRSKTRYEQFRLPDNGLNLIHAHTHHTHPTNGSVTGRELCVSWDAWRRLADMGDIAKWVKNIDSQN